MTDKEPDLKEYKCCLQLSLFTKRLIPKFDTGLLRDLMGVLTLSRLRLPSPVGPVKMNLVSLIQTKESVLSFTFDDINDSDVRKVKIQDPR